MGKQKRSENTYQKINTIFKRDANNVIMPYDDFVEPEFEFLRFATWRAEEKIDGTNMRIEVTSELNYCYPHPDCYGDEFSGVLDGVIFTVSYKGKTDNAQIPKELLKFMQEKYPEEKVLAALGLKKFIPVEEWETEHNWLTKEQIPLMYTIYGEGYGRGIQKGGGNYIKDGVGFIVFDVKVNDLYLLTDSRDMIAEKLGAPVVPFMGYFTFDEAIELVRNGFKSNIAENKDHLAEGLVLRTECGLKNRMGKRLITKIKTQDFVKYRNVYGTDAPVNQPTNTTMGNGES